MATQWPNVPHETVLNAGLSRAGPTQTSPRFCVLELTARVDQIQAKTRRQGALPELEQGQLAMIPEDR
jgi:hypothetical protein